MIFKVPTTFNFLTTTPNKSIAPWSLVKFLKKGIQTNKDS